MFPIGDDNPTRRPAVINNVLLAANILIFLFQLGAGEDFIIRWSFIPARLTALLDGSGSLAVLLTIFSAMFMHAGIGHIFGNMLFLWIFGDNVKDTFGRIPYLIFYLLCGIGATLVQYFTDPLSRIPNLGASGAISGVLAAYMVLFPWTRVRLAIWPLVLFLGAIPVPALLLIGIWFIMQLFSGFQTLGMVMSQGGTAFWAHIGGFVVGLALASFFPRSGIRPPTYYGRR